MPHVRFTAKAFHNGQYMEPGAECFVDESALGPHMDVLVDTVPGLPGVIPVDDQPEAPVIIIADQEAAAAPAQETVPGDA